MDTVQQQGTNQKQPARCGTVIQITFKPFITIAIIKTIDTSVYAENTRTSLGQTWLTMEQMQRQISQFKSSSILSTEQMSQTCNSVVVWTTLKARKNSFVYSLLKVIHDILSLRRRLANAWNKPFQFPANDKKQQQLKQILSNIWFCQKPQQNPTVAYSVLCLAVSTAASQAHLLVSFLYRP